MKKRISCLLLALMLILSAVTVQAAEWTCPNCGNVAADDDNFCGKCGTKRPAWYCPDCGAENTESFCTKCGSPKPTPDKEADTFIKEGVAAYIAGVFAFLFGGKVYKGTAEAGRTITFGSYPQGENGGAAPIDWEVLEVKDGKALIISKYGLDAKPYNEEWTDTTWEECTLRAWLNDAFLNAAFSEKEQKKIVETAVRAEDNPEYDTEAGRDTRDKVFLLSISEAKKYFDSDEDWKCVPTAYALENGCYTIDNYIAEGHEVTDEEKQTYSKDGKAACLWWLRSPGFNQSLASYVYSDGLLTYYVHTDRGCVRPALWLKIS